MLRRGLGHHRARTGPVFARLRARELEEHVIEGRAAEPKVAHRDPGATQLRGRLLDQLEAIAGGWKRQPVGALARLGLTAADTREHRPGAVALASVSQLDLEDLPSNLVLQLVSCALGDDLPVVDDSDPVCELVSLLEVLSGQQQRRALANELPHGRPNLVAAAGIEPSRGLVEEQNARARKQA